jgi:benzoate-CoA ligase family protein
VSQAPTREEKSNANISLVLDRQLAAGRGSRPAYVTDTGELTYAELLARSCRMGRLLRSLGVRREERVLLVLDDTFTFPAAFMGAARIGAVPVPVSVREHHENFRHFVTDSDARVVICEPALLEGLRASLEGREVRFLAEGADEDAATVGLERALAEHDGELAPVETDPDDMAFWLYTSGSTGRPKGVVHMHKALPAVCESFGRSVMALGEDERVFSSTKLYHSYGLGNSLAYPLYFGASAVLLAGPPAPERLIAALRRHQPDVYCSVPALYRQLLDDPDAEGAFGSVRTCISAAEPLPSRTFEAFEQRFGQAILDGIGATEMFVTFCSNSPGDVAAGTTGRPVPGYELRLLDEQGEPVADAGEGTLQVRGDSRAACYWHQEQRTREVMPGPWLTTGDRMRRREDGRYVYLGRADDMLKVGGLWVSPLDMELALSSHDAVAGAIVVGARIDDYMRLAAFVEREPAPAAPSLSEQELSDELRALCRERLREHEQPHVIRYLDELPRTLTGKPRRFMLRERLEAQAADSVAVPEGAATAVPAGGARAPSAQGTGDGERAHGARMSVDFAALAPGEREPALLELVRASTALVLAAPSAGAIDADREFVALGVDSLMAVELRNRLAAAIGRRLPSTLVFDHPTPAAAAQALAAELDGRTAGAADLSEHERAQLAELDEPKRRTRMPSAPLGMRLRTSALVNALLPAGVVVARAERRAAAIWELDGEERRAAVAATQIVLAGTSRAGELEQLSRRHLIEQLANRALFWQRPWRARTAEDSRQRIEQALAGDGGLLLSACHTGPYPQLDVAEPFRRRGVYLVPGPWSFDTPRPGAWGRRLARWRNGSPSRPVRATGSFRIIQALLRRGEAVFVFFDMPGPRQTPFLGKPTMLAEGTAQLSVRTGAPVLPVRARREGSTVWIDAGPLFDPSAHAGADQLHDALAAFHERWILEAPAAMDDPREFGWRDGAAPEAWVAPTDGTDGAAGGPDRRAG